MTDSMMFDFAADDTEAGFRLHRIEVYNWGTFDQRISTLELNGLNTLVTGENGSGKSTFVDALTTLLVPANRIAYNRAAGAEAKERDLRSYVLGYFRSEYNEMTGASKPVALRGKNASTYTVILGVFRNTGFDQVVTIAQVFWPANEGQPNRFFVLAERELSIADHFRGFKDGGIRQLKGQLRDHGAELFETYPPYGARLRRLVGIQSEQAMDLFHQTVSMKAVGNLTDFVRAHMLDVQPIKPRLDHLINHFENLTSAHDAVIRAKRQVALLTPIASEAQLHHEETDARDILEKCRECLRPYFGRLRVEFLASELARLATDRTKAEQQLDRARGSYKAAGTRVEAISAAIAGAGGDELHRLDNQLRDAATERDRRRNAAGAFEASARTAAIAIPTNEVEFVDMTLTVKARAAALDTDRAAHQNQITELSVALKELRTQHTALDEEIENLRSQRGNIPRAQIDLRHELARELSIDPAELPFAGELLRVRDGEAAWEGAAERLLHNFALSMLVPDVHYSVIQRLVDQRHLKQRLVYFRIPVRPRSRDEELIRFSLFEKLEVREDLPPTIAGWMRGELFARANVACCETSEQFIREPRAITAAGQIKGGNQRHEKDDRFRIDDRTKYVLGWSNEPKIVAMERVLRDLEAHAQQVGASLATLDAAGKSTQATGDALVRLEVYREFREIDWQSVAATIAELTDARASLLSTSNQLRELETQLADAKHAQDRASSDVDAEQQRLGAIGKQFDDTQEEHDELEAQFSEAVTGTAPAAVRERIRSLADEVIAEPLKRIRQLVEAESAAREKVQGELDATTKRIDRLSQALIGRMKDFARDFPQESQELDASLEALAGYLEILDRLRADDLPRFEAEFRELLNENTLREIAGFQQVLHQERTDIEERIHTINESLDTIEYNRGRYIALITDSTRDAEIRDFQAELRACTEGTVNMADDPVFVEQKFHQVRAIIERFRGRPETADADRRWTSKVTDVRNWFGFAASERWRHDGTEYEHYSDSSGKSGGQKEKLAYTVLAASLAYQFGLELGETVSRSFRFVAIDEAFGRADTEATRFGLELFAKLHLQLLVVTPLQRISIIEPYVRRVGFVSVQNDRSQITNLTIEEYRKRLNRKDS